MPLKTKREPAGLSLAQKYRTAMDQAKQQLMVALAFTEDGAPLDAIRTAAEGVHILAKASAMKAELLTKLK